MYPVTAGVVIQTKSLWDELQSALQGLPVRIALEQTDINDWTTFLQRIDRSQLDIVFLDVNDLLEPLDHVVRRIRNASTAPAVVVLNTTAAPDKILEAMRAGAAEYLYPPFKDQVRAAIERVGSERRATTQTRAPRGKTVGFLSAKGGCGST